jgi:hypothetical protein
VIKVDYWPNNMTLLLYMQQARREKRERERERPPFPLTSLVEKEFHKTGRGEIQQKTLW